MCLESSHHRRPSSPLSLLWCFPDLFNFYASIQPSYPPVFFPPTCFPSLSLCLFRFIRRKRKKKERKKEEDCILPRFRTSEFNRRSSAARWRDRSFPCDLPFPTATASAAVRRTVPRRKYHGTSFNPLSRSARWPRVITVTNLKPKASSSS